MRTPNPPARDAGHNPMQAVIRRQMGIDAFALDGDDSELFETWSDRPRAPRQKLPPMAP